MLSAESIALQARLVQQLASLQKDELDYLVTRFQSLGVQSALIASFIVGNFQNLYGCALESCSCFGKDSSLTGSVDSLAHRLSFCACAFDS